MENLLQLDELNIYRGKDIEIVEGITIHQPTLDEICDFGEDKYWGLVNTLTATPADLNWQLWEMDIDYTTISDFELFCNIVSKSVSIESSRIIFGDLDFSQFELFDSYKDNELMETFMQNNDNGLVINNYIYTMITDIIRKMHGFKKNSKLPGNDFTKQILIQDAKDDFYARLNKPKNSTLKNLVSALTNSKEFKYGHNEVWGMKINAFMDAVQRIAKIKDADLLLQSGYSGYGVDLSKIDKKKLEWLGELS